MGTHFHLGPTDCVLEKGGGSALPGFAFFLGDAFDVDDVGAGLCEDVV